MKAIQDSKSVQSAEGSISQIAAERQTQWRKDQSTLFLYRVCFSHCLNVSITFHMQTGDCDPRSLYMNSRHLFGGMIKATKSGTSRCSIWILSTNPHKRSNSAFALPKILNGEEKELSIAATAMWLQPENFNWEKILSTSQSAHSITRKLHSSKTDSYDL